MAIVYQYFMFTGIIEGTGIIKSLVKISENDKAADNRIEIDLGKLSKGLEIGDSVNVNGTCLTATRILKSVAFFEVVKETMKRTALGFLKVGDHVNLERSLRVNDRLEGHIVLGHVDGVGKIQEIKKDPSETKMWINVNKEISKYLVPKGSVALDGISFTIVDVSETRFSIALVPHTLAVTTFKNKQKGDKVNIEADILSNVLKHVKSIEHAIRALKEGKFILIHDSESRENEVDMMKPAQYINPRDVATMRNDAGGLICLAISGEIASKLDLIFMHDVLHLASKNNSSLSKMISSIAPYGDRPSFSIAINHIDTFTGITDKDRALTILKMAEVCSDIDNYGRHDFFEKFRSPGHVPLLIAANELLKERSGHTELSIQLMKLANLVPTAVICEMLDSETGGALSIDKATEYSSRFNIPLIESLQIKESIVN